MCGSVTQAFMCVLENDAEDFFYEMRLCMAYERSSPSTSPPDLLRLKPHDQEIPFCGCWGVLLGPYNQVCPDESLVCRSMHNLALT